MFFAYCFLRDIHKDYLTWNDADDKQNKLTSIDKGIKSIEKQLFLSNIRLLFTATEKNFNNFKNRIFPIQNLEKKLKPELDPELELELELELERKPKPKNKQF